MKRPRKTVAGYPYGHAVQVARQLGINPQVVRAVMHGYITSARVSAVLAAE